MSDAGTGRAAGAADNARKPRRHAREAVRPRARACIVLLFALMFAGLWWTRDSTPLSAAGSPVSAELTDTSDLSAAMRRALAKRPEPVKDEPVPPPPKTWRKKTPRRRRSRFPSPRRRIRPCRSSSRRRTHAGADTPSSRKRSSRDAISAETPRARAGREAPPGADRPDRTEAPGRSREATCRLAEQQDATRSRRISRPSGAKAQREADLAEQKLKQIADLPGCAGLDAARPVRRATAAGQPGRGCRI